MSKFIDLTNKKFDRLTVIRRAANHIQPNGSAVTMWECECECGNNIIVRAIDLTTKHTKSCGCLRKELKSKQNKKYNKYNLSGDFGIAYMNNGKKFLFDLEDYNKIKNYCWSENRNKWIQARDKMTDKPIKLSRLIMNFPKDMEVIYLNHDIFDNRKQNLKIVPPIIKSWGTKMYSNNTSGITGVFLNKRRNKWDTYITVNKTRKYLGSYKNKSDAIKARKEAEAKYFGEYSYDNRMKGDKNNE